MIWRGKMLGKKMICKMGQNNFLSKKLNLRNILGQKKVQQILGRRKEV